MQGYYEALEKGTLSGNAVGGVRLVLNDGAHHAVDSSELAFRLAIIGAFREAFVEAGPIILEPIMTVEVVAPVEFQSAVIGSLTTRRGTITDSEVREDEFTVTAEVSLNAMFGYSNQLRGSTQGKGEFSMEYKVRRLMRKVEPVLIFSLLQSHEPVLANIQKEMEAAYRKSIGMKEKK